MDASRNVRVDFDSGARIELDGEWCSVCDPSGMAVRVPREEILRFVHVFVGTVIEDACECESLGSSACVWSPEDDDDES